MLELAQLSARIVMMGSVGLLSALAVVGLCLSRSIKGAVMGKAKRQERKERRAKDKQEKLDKLIDHKTSKKTPPKYKTGGKAGATSSKKVVASEREVEVTRSHSMGGPPDKTQRSRASIAQGLREREKEHSSRLPDQVKNTIGDRGGFSRPLNQPRPRTLSDARKSVDSKTKLLTPMDNSQIATARGHSANKNSRSDYDRGGSGRDASDNRGSSRPRDDRSQDGPRSSQQSRGSGQDGDRSRQRRGSIREFADKPKYKHPERRSSSNLNTSAPLENRERRSERDGGNGRSGRRSSSDPRNSRRTSQDQRGSGPRRPSNTGSTGRRPSSTPPQSPTPKSSKSKSNQQGNFPRRKSSAKSIQRSETFAESTRRSSVDPRRSVDKSAKLVSQQSQSLPQQSRRASEIKSASTLASSKKSEKEKKKQENEKKKQDKSQKKRGSGNVSSTRNASNQTANASATRGTTSKRSSVSKAAKIAKPPKITKSAKNTKTAKSDKSKVKKPRLRDRIRKRLSVSEK